MKGTGESSVILDTGKKWKPFICYAAGHTLLFICRAAGHTLFKVTVSGSLLSADDIDNV